jgi:hypothetical protein
MPILQRKIEGTEEEIKKKENEQILKKKNVTEEELESQILGIVDEIISKNASQHAIVGVIPECITFLYKNYGKLSEDIMSNVITKTLEKCIDKYADENEKDLIKLCLPVVSILVHEMFAFKKLKRYKCFKCA